MRLGEAVRVVHRLRHLGLGLEIRRRAAPKPLVGCRRADLALLLIPALEQLFEVIGQQRIQIVVAVEFVDVGDPAEVERHS